MNRRRTRMQSSNDLVHVHHGDADTILVHHWRICNNCITDVRRSNYDEVMELQLQMELAPARWRSSIMKSKS